jgi:hypothetical protein
MKKAQVITIILGLFYGVIAAEAASDVPLKGILVMRSVEVIDGTAEILDFPPGTIVTQVCRDFVGLVGADFTLIQLIRDGQFIVILPPGGPNCVTFTPGLLPAVFNWQCRVPSGASGAASGWPTSIHCTAIGVSP